MHKNASLTDWLSYIEQAHVKEIDMGLSRTAEMVNRLEIGFLDQIVITVGGTNGKGTTCALIEQVCLEAGLSVGVYSSPHLVSFCERIRINGRQVQEALLCESFYTINSVRSNNDIALTYFEFATLAGLHIFSRQALDVVILEVGLGGRLDATNVIDADIAVITSIGLDHQEWLGDTKEKIGFEKAGIFRAQRPVIIGEKNPPVSMLQHANLLQAKQKRVGRDFFYHQEQQIVELANKRFSVANAKIPKVNVATALAVVSAISDLTHAQMPLLVSDDKIQACIEQTQVLGRHTKWPKNTLNITNNSSMAGGTLTNHCEVLLDVAHNEDSAVQLRQVLRTYSFDVCHIVVGMLKDKNIEVSLAAFKDVNATWYCASLPSARGEQAARLQNSVGLFAKATPYAHDTLAYESVEAAFRGALSEAKAGDLILVLGSFLTVAAVLELNASA
ncbi:bifunctional tetrahydrofolate synthase/dihydrofolate synthase [Glaciecola sp. MH2013]|uniref:bifunctional tetrahydrofolate synthase/dihydrofolate synthase n=1 Tax=Glaciecola sp. MH2013 TaxID=2785524 RepID=UPI00189EB254|nr:bifunctional tetrahydrofolate synthase/dihydrofolate synthase [Glaciecola sp. MH2013]MBF7073122.1 bifunctional tetrahydrofolate synthase/dihydrofolate synthase [Glaciecola sp. MH2013]